MLVNPQAWQTGAVMTPLGVAHKVGYVICFCWQLMHSGICWWFVFLWFGGSKWLVVVGGWCFCGFGGSEQLLGVGGWCWCW